MKRARRRGINLTMVMLALLLGFMVMPGRVHANEAEEGKRIIKVAYPIVSGFSEIDENGKRYGLVVDFLNEISNYTGWEYEFVDMNGSEAVDNFLEGECDLIGGTYYSPEFEQYFAYPDYSTGFSKSVLLARWDDYSIKSFDKRSLNGKTIGVYERAEENIRRLQEFLRVNDLQCSLKYYSYDQYQKANSLYPYQESGEVDLLLGGSADVNGPFRVVTSYDSQPHYIVCQPGDTEVLDGLNMALKKIYEANPNYAEECYAKNFPDVNTEGIQLTEDERDFISEVKTVKVAVPEKLHPMFCLGQNDGQHDGIVPDILKEVSDYSGLQFSYVYGVDYQETIEMVRRGEADMAGFFTEESDYAAEKGLALTKPYVNLGLRLVRNKYVSYPSEGLTGAVLEGQQMPDGIKAETVVYYSDMASALKAADKGDVDFVCGIAAQVEQNMQHHHYSNLIEGTLADDRLDVSFAIKRPVDTPLFSVLNKAISRMPPDRRSTLLDKNIVSFGEGRVGLIDFIYAEPILSVSLMSVVLLIVAAALMALVHVRMQRNLMRVEMERVEEEARAKSEFLSRMSHEIRTPVNAIVGLTDLMDMMEGVPPLITDNLHKIRNSARYLLNLINDILDMNKIGSGKIVLAQDPFSMGEMMGELKDMLTAEARRRELDFQIRLETEHDGFIGDRVRLRQILTNLLNNAFKFTPSGGRVCITVREVCVEESGSDLFFLVEDNGIGIASQDRERIFQSFEQAGNVRSMNQGTGLGLPISYSFVKVMGGELTLDSEEGKGSRFCFTIHLPFGEPDKEEEPLRAEGLLSGSRILLAEDNDLNAEIAIELLKMQGAKVKRVKDGQEAVAVFAESRPGDFQAILMDVRMPRMSGLEACRAIRSMEREEDGHISIIAMTANSFKEDVDAAKDAGMDAFVPKPLDIKYLYHVLYKAVKNAPERG